MQSDDKDDNCSTNSCAESELSISEQVTLYIQEHCTEKLNCSLIAQAFSYHPNSLNRIMQEEAGCSLHDAITRVKIEEAIRLLTETDIGIADIAYRMNFYDHAHFAKTFRDVTGFTPSDYREAHQTTET